MKKYLALVLTLMLTLTCVAVMAEAVDAAPVLFDGKQILTDIMVWVLRIVTAAVVSGLGWIGRQYVVPWLKDQRLTNLAMEMVRAAEAKLGRYVGPDKLDYALDQMALKGLRVDKETVKQAVLAAWWDLNAQMIELGLKEPPEEVLEHQLEIP